MAKTLIEVLHSEIPLTKEIGIQIEHQSETSLSLSAPLDRNINHKDTAFGGSLYCVAVLTGWGLIYQLLERQGLTGHIVIQKSETEFLKPVTDKIIAECTFGSALRQQRFLKMLERKDRARIQLETHIKCDDITHVIFKGSYVVHR